MQTHTWEEGATRTYFTYSVGAAQSSALPWVQTLLTAAAPCVCSSLSLLWSPTSTSLHPLIAKDSLVTTDAGCQQIITLQSAGEDNSLGPRLRLWDATAAQALQQWSRFRGGSELQGWWAALKELPSRQRTTKQETTSQCLYQWSTPPKGHSMRPWFMGQRELYGGKNWHRSLLLPPLCWLIKWIMIKLGSLIKQERDARGKKWKTFRKRKYSTILKSQRDEWVKEKEI